MLKQIMSLNQYQTFIVLHNSILFIKIKERGPQVTDFKSICPALRK